MACHLDRDQRVVGGVPPEHPCFEPQDTLGAKQFPGMRLNAFDGCRFECGCLAKSSWRSASFHPLRTPRCKEGLSFSLAEAPSERSLARPRRQENARQDEPS